MQSSMFNLRVPLPARDEVFLMNTLTDAQIVVSSDVAALLDRFDASRTTRARALGAPQRRRAGRHRICCRTTDFWSPIARPSARR